MSRSLIEEVIAALWAICAVLCFGFGFKLWGFAFTVKAVFDVLMSMKFGIKEAIDEKENLK